MKLGPRTIAATVAVLVAGPAPSAYAGAGTRATAPGPVAIGPATAACGAAQLSATYALDPFSQGAGHVSYTLTITNTAKTACELSAPQPWRLLSKSGKALPTHAYTSPGGHYTLTLAAGQWAQADSRFSPDVSGPGEGNPCEPTANRLRIAIGSGSGHISAPMDPTRVCEHGQIAFARLRAVAVHPACAAASLTANFKRVSRNGTSADYGLVLSNTGAATCYLAGAPGLRLLSTSGAGLPTRALTSVPYPIVVGHHHEVSLLANFASISRPGSGEPSHGPCEPTAAKVQISPHPGRGHLTAALAPPTTVCHRGTMTLSGLVPGDPFP